MLVTLPYELTYGITDSLDADIVAQSIVTNKKALIEARRLLQLLIPTLEIDEVYVHVNVISQQSPLREAFFAVLLVKYQPTLERDIPKIITDLTGKVIPEEYRALLSLVVITLVFYGAGMAIEFLRKGSSRLLVDRHFQNSINDLAAITGAPVEKIMKVLDENYIGVKKRSLIHTATEFFLPIKRARHGDVTLSGRPTIEHKTILEIPDSALIEKEAPDDITAPYQGVQIKIIAQDQMRAKMGWAGIVSGVSEERLRMQIMPPIQPEEIYLRESVKGDIIVFSRLQDDGTYKPYLFYLVRIYD